ncbi:hypothetical protein F4803DRAFT_553847 [Xylaria telfairii]|nr:hypothetical protein F4803DRAFT_553847 [Xylaria telfairii]
MDPIDHSVMATEAQSHGEMEEEPLYEEFRPDFEDVLGAFRTKNPAGNRSETPAKTVPMTLIVYGVGLNCHAPEFRIRSVRMWLAFYEDDKADAPNKELAAPELVAWAPFVQQNQCGESEETIEEKTTISGTAGIDYVANADANLGKEITSSYTRKRFDHGSTDRLNHDYKTYGINWCCEQNNLQRYGVKPNFHIAVLVKRSHTTANKSITFKAIFDIRIDAGLSHDLEQRCRRAFRLWKPEDEPMYYDPAMKNQVGGPEGSGEAIYKKAKKDSLGERL